MKFMNLSLTMVLLSTSLFPDRVFASDPEKKELERPPYRTHALPAGTTIPAPTLTQAPPPAYAFDHTLSYNSLHPDHRLEGIPQPLYPPQPMYPTADPRGTFVPLSQNFYQPPWGQGYTGQPSGPQTLYDPRVDQRQIQSSSSPWQTLFVHPAPAGAPIHPGYIQQGGSTSVYLPDGNHHHSSSPNLPSPVGRPRTTSGGADSFARLCLQDSSADATTTDDGEETEEDGTGEHSLEMLKQDRCKLIAAWTNLTQAADIRELALTTLLRDRRKSIVTAVEKSPTSKSPIFLKSVYKGARKLAKGSEALEEEKLEKEDEEYEAQARPAKKLIRRQRRQYAILTEKIGAAILAINGLTIESLSTKKK